MEKNIKKIPKEKTLYEVRCISNTICFSVYIVAKNSQEAQLKAKNIYPYMAISTITNFLTIHD